LPPRVFAGRGGGEPKACLFCCRVRDRNPSYRSLC
jgi:hypothetical protein